MPGCNAVDDSFGCCVKFFPHTPIPQSTILGGPEPQMSAAGLSRQPSKRSLRPAAEIFCIFSPKSFATELAARAHIRQGSADLPPQSRSGPDIRFGRLWSCPQPWTTGLEPTGFIGRRAGQGCRPTGEAPQALSCRSRCAGAVSTPSLAFRRASSWLRNQLVFSLKNSSWT
jgi:hypothetical protein